MNNLIKLVDQSITHDEYWHDAFLGLDILSSQYLFACHIVKGLIMLASRLLLMKYMDKQLFFSLILAFGETRIHSVH